MSSKRSMSWPRSSHQDPEKTKKRNTIWKDKKIRKFEKFLINWRLDRAGYDISTGLLKGVTQEQFDKANADFRIKKSDTACSQVECQPVTID
jgi:hypothetical protein